jgi:PAS domain S-box-containing protein
MPRDEPGSSPSDGDWQIPQAALIASGHAFAVSDAQLPDWPLIWVNPAFEELTGYSATDVNGHNCRLLQGELTDRGATARIRSALTAGRSVTETLVNYRKDGGAWWNEVIISPVRDSTGVLTHFVGVQSDVSARVRSDAQRDAAREEADAAIARLGLLVEVGTMIASTVDAGRAAELLTTLLVPAFADWASVVTVDASRPLAPVGRHVVALAGVEQQPEALDEGPQAEVLRTGNGQLLRSDEPGSGYTSAIVVPLPSRGEPIGCLTVGYSDGERTYSAEDLDFATELGRRVGTALETMRLYDAEHRVALTLQQSLLPRLPQIPGLALAARYLPGAELAAVGGDWYDVLRLPDGATGIAIGDVMGHDMQAAATMGQLRSVLRSYAWEGHSPAGVLDRVNQLVCGLDLRQLATCVYARIEPETPEQPTQLRVSNAGHPPPLLKTPDGVVHVLDDAVGPLVGVLVGNAALLERTGASYAMPAGSTLLLYTDGLIESRDYDLDVGIKRLHDVLTSAPAGIDLDQLADRITAAAGRSSENDDQCLLLAHME